MTQSHDTEREDRAILRALELLDRCEAVPPGETPDEADGELVAAYLETWTALPEALPQAEPRPELKAQLLALVGAEASPASARKSSQPTVLPFVQTPSAPRLLSVGWYQALAASLLLTVLGLGVFSFHLSQKVERQGDELAALVRSLALGHKEAELTRANYAFPDLENRFAPVSAARTRLFSLVAEGPAGAAVRGAMVVCAKHRQWLLRVDGLSAPAQGQAYHLWFETQDGPVYVGRLLLDDALGAEVGSAFMPEQTLGLVISRETETDLGSQPRGPILARAGQPEVI
jgi:hypothetical protein